MAAKIRIIALATLLVGLAAAEVRASIISWTDWTSASAGASGSAIGSLTIGSETIGVSYTGDVAFAQLSGGTDYWNPSTPYTSNTVVDNRPTGTDIVALKRLGITNTITFSRAVLNPIMAIVSQGRPTSPVRYYFSDAPFDVLSSGRGYWGGDPAGSLFEEAGDVLRGIEGHGVIQFQGSFSSISWVVSPNEDWHGFTIGTQVPEPAAIAIWGTLGSLGLIAARRRKRAP